MHALLKVAPMRLATGAIVEEPEEKFVDTPVFYSPLRGNFLSSRPSVPVHRWYQQGLWKLAFDGNL